MAINRDQLLAPLKQYFGFSSFRPLQAEIITDTLAGRDVLAVLPTGGGKSLCFQLPALVESGLTVVVSPLIALMKDQVDALQTAGVPATFLNSSLAAGESRPRLRALHQGEYRLLYVAPERLLQPGFLDDLKRWNVRRLAIDEAHCISEWGHDFRPEYRQISVLRNHFPGVPVLALTATATGRVRTDIIRQLDLQSPAEYVASFNRPNLTYRVVGKSGAYGQMLDFLRARPRESGIVYVQARKTAEDLAHKLTADGISALPYHAGLEGDTRPRNQEAFLRDEVRVVCATIAFGMGINKPNVRYVIHYDLPKNIEGYYQETGRAGRDGLPGECLLFFSPGDRVKQMRFIDEKPNPQERDQARAQLEQMLHYAESAGCRRHFLLGYFGEEFPGTNCGACDNCLAPRATWDGTIAAQKFLSCVHRIRAHSGHGVGVQHVVEVLCGAETEKIRQSGHHTLSTYGIGTEHTRAEWAAIGRELVRLGLLRQNVEQFHTLEITPAGRTALKTRQSITLTKSMAAASTSRAHRAGEIACDEVLFERLRTLRKQLADDRAVPSYIIFSDVTLRQMARNYPQTPEAFMRISGVGEKKLREFGGLFLAEIGAHLQSNPRQMFADDSFAEPAAPIRSRAQLGDTVRETLNYCRLGRTVEDIARVRGLKVGTIYSHLEEAILAGEPVPMDHLISAAAHREIAAAFAQHGRDGLVAVVESLHGKHDFGLCRLVRAEMTRGNR